MTRNQWKQNLVKSDMPGHHVKLAIIGGDCTRCPLGSAYLHVYDCECSLQSVCRDCWYDHVADLIKEITSRNCSDAHRLGRNCKLAEYIKSHKALIDQRLKEK